MISSEQYTPFLKWHPLYFTTTKSVSPVFLSLVSMVRDGYPFDEKLATKASKFLSSISQKFHLLFNYDDFLMNIGQGSPDTAAVILSTPSLSDLSVVDDQDILDNVLWILQISVSLSPLVFTPSIAFDSQIGPQVLRAVVFHEMFVAIEPSLTQISRNRLLRSLEAGYRNTLDIISHIFHMSVFHQPILDFICSSHIPMVYQSLLSKVEDEDTNQFIIWFMFDSIRSWQNHDTETWCRGRILMQTLEQEGFRNHLEQTLLHDKSSADGKDVRLYSYGVMNDLNDLVLPEIFKYCDLDTLSSLRITTKRFYHLLQPDYIWGHACVSYVAQIRKQFDISDPPNRHLQDLDVDSAITSHELHEHGMSTDGFFDTIRFHRQAVINTTPAPSSSLIQLQKNSITLNSERRRLVSFGIILAPLVVATFVSVVTSMSTTSKGLTPTDPFPWFLSDLLLCLVGCVLVCSINSTSDSPDTTVFRSSLLVAFLAFVPLFIVEIVANTTTLRSLSVNPETPLPNRARIPFKFLCCSSLVLCQMLSKDFSLFFSSNMIDNLYRIAALIIILEPLIVTLTGLGVLKIPWLLAEMPLNLASILFAVVDCSKFLSTPSIWIGTIVTSVSSTTFHLPFALAADDVIPLPLWLCVLPASLFVVTMLFVHFFTAIKGLNKWDRELNAQIVSINEKREKTLKKKVQHAISTRFQQSQFQMDLKQKGKRANRNKQRSKQELRKIKN
ncbi:hypothetical protein BLNAU_10872 [Blattamonas nauphoetae]|uniref:F-box domain-containing protein n=1 Tax=Blattamonas nauphoetae TaxID=2049346 RepID=A0ABQ9XP73_9EUKA|nr:hypothetical protein BLNAU_10872 [Blattamonas nauphoetae]